MATVHQQILSVIQPFVDRLNRMERQYNELQLECQSLKDQLRNANLTGIQNTGKRGVTDSSRKRVVTLMSPSNRATKEDLTNIVSTKTSRFPGTNTEILKKSANPRPLTAMSPNISKFGTRLAKSPVVNHLPGKMTTTTSTNSKNAKFPVNGKSIDVKIIKGNTLDKEPKTQPLSIIPTTQVKKSTQSEGVPPHSKISEQIGPQSKVLRRLDSTDTPILNNNQDLKVNLDILRTQTKKSQTRQLLLNTHNATINSEYQSPSQITEVLVQQVKLQRISSAQSMQQSSEKQIPEQGKLSILISNDSRPFASFVENEPSTTQLDEAQGSDQLI